MGIALAPGDEETLYAYITTDSDDRLVRVSLSGGRVGRPRALLTDIPTSAPPPRRPAAVRTRRDAVPVHR